MLPDDVKAEIRLGFEIANRAIKKEFGDDAASAWRFGIELSMSGLGTVEPVQAEKFKLMTKAAMVAVLAEMGEKRGSHWVKGLIIAVQEGERIANGGK